MTTARKYVLNPELKVC